MPINEPYLTIFKIILFTLASALFTKALQFLNDLETYIH